jgi:hypothetical protein
MLCSFLFKFLIEISMGENEKDEINDSMNGHRWNKFTQSISSSLSIPSLFTSRSSLSISSSQSVNSSLSNPQNSSPPSTPNEMNVCVSFAYQSSLEKLLEYFKKLEETERETKIRQEKIIDKQTGGETDDYGSLSLPTNSFSFFVYMAESRLISLSVRVLYEFSYKTFLGQLISLEYMDDFLKCFINNLHSLYEISPCRFNNYLSIFYYSLIQLTVFAKENIRVQLLLLLQDVIPNCGLFNQAPLLTFPLIISSNANNNNNQNNNQN